MTNRKLFSALAVAILLILAPLRETPAVADGALKSEWLTGTEKSLTLEMINFDLIGGTVCWVPPIDPPKKRCGVVGSIIMSWRKFTLFVTNTGARVTTELTFEKDYWPSHGQWFMYPDESSFSLARKPIQTPTLVE